MFRPRNFLLGGITKNLAIPGFKVASSINFQISLMAVVAVEAKGREVAPPFLLFKISSHLFTIFLFLLISYII